MKRYKMIKTSKLFITLLWLALIAMPVANPCFASRLSRDETAKLVAESPGQAEYPEAGALILYNGKTLTVLENNDQVFEEHLLVKVLKDRARGFGDQKRSFDARTDSVAVLIARSWLQDGTTVPVEDKAVNVITPPELVGAAVYADIKQKVVSFPSIAPGTVIEILTRTISRADTSSGVETHPYWDMESFRGDEPVLWKWYSLEIPAKLPRPLFFTSGGLGEPVEEAKNGLRTYRWEVRDVPMIHRIPYMPPARSFVPFLVFSNVPDWEELGKWLGKKIFPAAAPDEAVRARVAELTRECATSADSVRAISLFVTTQVRNIGLSPDITGYKPTPAPKVLANMYGHGLDKAVLLSAMLTAAGFENYPALAGSGQLDLVELSVPAAIQMSRVAVHVPGTFTDSCFTNPLYDEPVRQGLWLVPVAQYNRYGFFVNGQGSRALVILPEGGTISRAEEFPPEKSLSISHGTLALNDQGDLKGSYRAVTDGLFDCMARTALKDKTPREVDQYFQQAANAIGEGAVEESHSLGDLHDLAAGADAELVFSAPELGVVQGDMMILRIPLPPFSFSGLPYFPKLEEREFDFVAQGPFVLVNETVIEMPPGWGIVYKPQEAHGESRFGVWTINCRSAEGERRMVYEKKFTLSSHSISCENYPEFKTFCETFTLPRHSLLLLEKKGSGAGK
ncbi:MAG: DUF3857 domain-containing protein [Gemmatimonadota bacterium]|nr:DUF3857 domain-containing protein [Gemmatimonadota bacterium]